MAGRLGTSANDANYGKGFVQLDDAELSGNVHAEAIGERLNLLFRSTDYTPPLLPAAAVEVHRLTQAQDVRIEQILGVLEKDPMLAARILRVASSPVYGGQAVDSLQTAVMRLGLRTLADLVWEVALNMRVFRSKAYEAPMEAVRRHSIAVAHVSRAIAKLTPVPLEYAFLCGLLHDVGAAAALHLLGEGGSNAGAGPLSSDVLEIVLGKAHAEASQQVARLWGMSGDVQLVLAHHHAVSVQGYPHPTAAIIAIAEQAIGEELGKGAKRLAWDQTREAAFMAARDALSLSARSLDAVKKDTRNILAKLEKAA
jgi:putative nucleotidyltransferase with HDIG domain